MIYGKATLLRRPDRDDLPHFVRWLNNPETRRYLQAFQPMSLTEEEQWFDGLLKDTSRATYFYCIAARESGELIGNVGLKDVDTRCRSAELGIMIGDGANQNRGYGTDAMLTMLRFSFEELNLNRVMLRVHEDNVRAIRVYEKVGFVHEGRLRQAQWKSGRYYDILIMAILRDEWFKQRPAA